MCAEPIGERHGHVADVGGRRLLCTCRGCYLLFTSPGAGGLRMRAVPTEVRSIEDLELREEQWHEFAVPVDLLFAFRQSDLTGDAPPAPVVSYPSPAGATESETPEQVWATLAAAGPALGGLADDVEAILLRRTAPGAFDCLVVPIDVCYELVGLVRTHWSGFRGGTELWGRIEEFFDGVASRVKAGSPR